MTIVYDRKILLAKAYRAESERKARHEKALTQYAINEARRTERWLEANETAWRTAITKIRSKLSKGLPVVPEDLPKDGRGYTLTFTPDREPTSYQDRDLATLVAVLESSTNDTIKVTELSAALGSSLVRGALRSIAYYVGEEV